MKFCWNHNWGMDERQLKMRGNVFQHTMILYMAALLADGFLTDCGIIWAPGFQKNLIILWLGLDLALCEYVLRDIAPAGGRNDILYILEGVFGLLLLCLSLSALFKGRPLTNGSALSREGAHLAVSLLMCLSFFVFLCKRVWGRFHQAEDED
ncbi:hypothetical protein AALA61_03500 [Oscillospiraceae bacterium 42-9]